MFYEEDEYTRYESEMCEEEFVVLKAIKDLAAVNQKQLIHEIENLRKKVGEHNTKIEQNINDCNTKIIAAREEAREANKRTNEAIAILKDYKKVDLQEQWAELLPEGVAEDKYIFYLGSSSRAVYNTCKKCNGAKILILADTSSIKCTTCDGGGRSQCGNDKYYEMIEKKIVNVYMKPVKDILTLHVMIQGNWNPSKLDLDNITWSMNKDEIKKIVTEKRVESLAKYGEGASWQA